MARYMQQDLFDVLAVAHVTLHHADPGTVPRKFGKLLLKYRRSYPDENMDVLVGDLLSLAPDIRKVADDIYQVLHRPQDNPAKKSTYFSVLTTLSSVIQRQARRRRPWFKRIYGGTRFNYESSPLPERIDACRTNVREAGTLILTIIRSPALNAP